MPDAIKANRRIVNAVKESVLTREPARARSSNYLIQDEVVARNERVFIPRQTVKADRPTIVVFADDAPLYNWAHPCRYLLHDAESGEPYREIAAQFPPFPGERESAKSYRAFHQPVLYPPQEIYPIPKPGILWPRARGRRHALLFSGMSNNRHTNDLEFLYRALIDSYGYDKSDITVLNHDGTLNYDGDPHPVVKWPGDSTAYRMPVNGKGSKAALLGALDDLKKRLKPDDSLLIHTNNHGGHDGTESNLCCYPSWDSLGVKDFANKLGQLPKFRCLIVMMEQCHSGGFNSAVIAKSTATRTSIASACTEFNNSIGGAHFDPFARDWIAAVAGADPYGHALAHDPDSNHDGRVSAKEAFAYADSIHDPYDTPIYNQAGGGGTCSLGRELIRWPLPPFLIEVIIRKFWPEPDPLVDKRVRSILPQVEALEKELETTGAKLHEEFTKRLTDIIKQARKVV